MMRALSRTEVVDFHRLLILLDHLRYGEGVYMGAVRDKHQTGVRFGWMLDVLGCHFGLETTERAGFGVPTMCRLSGRDWALNFRFVPVPGTQWFIPPNVKEHLVTCFGIVGTIQQPVLTGSFDGLQTDLLLFHMAFPQERLNLPSWWIEPSTHKVPTVIDIREAA